jgi:hypothetical protein
MMEHGSDTEAKTIHGRTPLHFTCRKGHLAAVEELFNSMYQQVLSNIKIPMHIRRNLYQVIVVYIALWGSESWVLKEDDRFKRETFHHNCIRRMRHWTMWDAAEKQITNETVRMTAANSPAMESMMEVRKYRKVKISKEANAWSMVSNTKTSRETAADHTGTPCLRNLEHENGHLRE